MLAGTYFPKVRRMLLFLAPLSLIHFWPASTLFHEHTALAIPSLLETDPQIMEHWGLCWWGSPGQIIQSEGLWSRMSAWRTTDFVNFTHRIGFRMSELFRKIDFGGFVPWKTQPNCRVLGSNRSLFQLMTGITIDIGSSRSLVTFVTVDDIRFRANHASSTWLLHFCHHSLWTFY